MSLIVYEKSRDKNIFFERDLVSKSQNRPMNCSFLLSISDDFGSIPKRDSHNICLILCSCLHAYKVLESVKSFARSFGNGSLQSLRKY